MATTKIKPIRKTLDKALAYIIDGEKTANGSLVSSYGCGVGTADIQMRLTAKQGSGRGNRIAYHLMQSFSPDDNITPEQANKIGVEFAQKVIKGKYEFVVATHIDKGHIHNHIIFNATNFYDYTKYHYGAGERDRIREISDNLCRENNLSVIERTSGAKGKTWYESKKKRSWKDIARMDIDDAISQAKTFDEFLQIMELEKDYTIAQRGSFLRLHPPGYEKMFRLDAHNLGNAYTEEAIKDRIEHPENADKYKTVISKNTKENAESEKKENTTESKKDGARKDAGETKKKQVCKPDPRRINLIVDISKNLKAQESAGYEQALIRSNINTLVKTMNFLIKNNLKTADDFGNYYSGKMAEYKLIHDDTKNCENKMFASSEKIKFLQNYKKYHNLYMTAKRADANSKFFREHQDEITLFEASRLYFEHIGENPDELNLSDLFEAHKALNEDKAQTEKVFKSIKKELKELDIIRQNVEETLGINLVEKEEQSSTAKEKSKKTDGITY